MTTTEERQWVRISEKYRPSIIYALVVQIVILGVAAITFDSGLTLRIAAASLIPSLLGSIWIIRKRPKTPTRVDLLFIRHGYLVCFAVLSLLEVLNSA
jgi:hypothetical protein